MRWLEGSSLFTRSIAQIFVDVLNVSSHLYDFFFADLIACRLGLTVP
jgi:hypothetical protein